MAKGEEEEEGGAKGTPQNSAFLRYGSLLLLIVQNTLLVLCMRSSLTVKGEVYAPSTAVAVMECVKFVTCLAVVFFTEAQGFSGLYSVLRRELVGKPLEMLKLAVPSFTYVIQNQLLYFALSNLEAAPYQVLYQSKILTTAVFSVLILGRRLGVTQWLSLLLLTAGVAMAELASHGDAPERVNSHYQNHFLGFIAVVVAACLSGFSGVYFESILKGARASLWVRNLQMGFTSVLLAFVGVFTKDLAFVRANGFFHGYSSLVWTVIMLQALGGLTVASVVKYADNILKGFAASFSIILSCILSMIFLEFTLTPFFVVGAVLVNFSSWLYGQNFSLFSSRGSGGSGGGQKGGGGKSTGRVSTADTTDTETGAGHAASTNGATTSATAGGLGGGDMGADGIRPSTSPRRIGDAAADVSGAHLVTRGGRAKAEDLA